MHFSGNGDKEVNVRKVISHDDHGVKLWLCDGVVCHVLTG